MGCVPLWCHEQPSGQATNCLQCLCMHVATVWCHHAVHFGVALTLLASTTICASSVWLFTSPSHGLILSNEALLVAS